MSQPGQTPAAEAAEPAPGLPEIEVWQLLGRADVIVRGVIEAQDAAQRRRWQERAQVWLRDLNRAWVQHPLPAGRPGSGGQS